MDGHRPCFAYYGDSVNHVTHDQALDSQDCTPNTQGRSQDFEFRGLKPMASAERKPITGVWGQSPWWEVRGLRPPEAERVLAVGRPVEAANFPHSMHF